MMSPRLVIVSDFHAGIWSKYSKPCDDINTRFHHERLVLRHIFQFASKKKASVIFDGDLFDTRKNIDCRVTNMVFQEIIHGAVGLQKHGGQGEVFLLAGNHDQVDNSRRPKNSLGIFKGISPLIHVIDKPLWFNEDNSKWPVHNVLFFLPYSEDKKWLQHYLDNWAYNNKIVLKKSKGKTQPILFGHLGVAGAKMGAHLVRLSGEFSLNDLHPDAFKWVILGHYHHRQYLNKQQNAWYVGNTIPLRFEDAFQTKGFWYLDTISHESKFVPVKSPMFYEFDIKTFFNNFLKKHNTSDAKEQFREQIFDIAKKNIVRVDSSDSHLLSYYARHGCYTKYIPNQNYKPRLNIKPQSTSKQIVSKYIDKYYPSKNATNHRRLENTALGILDKAREKLK